MPQLVDITEERKKVIERKNQIVQEMTNTLIELNNFNDNELKEKLKELETIDKTLSWFLNEILIEKYKI